MSQDAINLISHQREPEKLFITVYNKDTIH